MHEKHFTKSKAQFKVLIDVAQRKSRICGIRIVIKLNRKTQNDLCIGLILGRKKASYLYNKFDIRQYCNEQKTN